MSTADLFGAPTLAENVSGGLLAEIWEKVKKKEWRLFTPDNINLPVLIEKYVTREATAYDLLMKPLVACEPIASVMWRSETGIRHEGAVWLNGALLRQVKQDGTALLILMCEEEVAERIEAACRPPQES